MVMQNMCFIRTLSEIKVQKLSLGRYLFKRYTFAPVVPNRFKYIHFSLSIYVPFEKVLSQ